MSFPTSYSDPYPDAGNSSHPQLYTSAAIGDVLVLFYGLPLDHLLPEVTLGDEIMTLLAGSIAYADTGYLAFGIYALICAETHAPGESIGSEAVSPSFYMSTITTPTGGTVGLGDLVSACVTRDDGASSFGVNTGESFNCIWLSGAATDGTIEPETGEGNCTPGIALHAIGLSPDAGVGWSGGPTLDQAATWLSNSSDWMGSGIVALPLSGAPPVPVDTTIRRSLQAVQRSAIFCLGDLWVPPRRLLLPA